MDELRKFCDVERRRRGYHRTAGPVSPSEHSRIIVTAIPPPPHFAWLMRELARRRP